MSGLPELLKNSDFRYFLIPPLTKKDAEGCAFIPFLDLRITNEDPPGAYLVISALRKISTWHESPSGERKWGFTMQQAYAALQEMGVSDEEASWFLVMLIATEPMVPLYFENEKPPAR